MTTVDAPPLTVTPWTAAGPGEPLLDGRTPAGPLSDAWESRRFEMKLVNPANKRRFHVLVVGSGLAGA
ncbi:MAG: hypothetical protein ACYDAD_13520, partial [Acidimicrobiales bacterium]